MATSTRTISSEWDHLCSLARKRWHQLTEEDLRVPKGNLDELIARIQQKTGEGREAIQSFFSELTARGASAAGHAAESGGRYVHQASDEVGEGLECVEDLVRRNPKETVVLAFGVGVVAGLIAGLAIRVR